MGNKNSGRRKNEQPMRHALLQILDQIDATKQRKRMFNVLHKLVESGEEGNMAAIIAILERVDGKVPQAHRHGGDPENDEPIRVDPGAELRAMLAAKTERLSEGDDIA